MSISNNIWVYARSRVDNKGVLSRVAHSAKFHSVRSAFSSKGSAISKGAGLATMALRVGIGAIPIPSIVTDLFSTAQQAIEAKIRKHLHSKHTVVKTNKEDWVKFTLKDLSVEELDRYRWKLKDAIEEFNKKSSTIDALLKTYEAETKPCDAWLEYAEVLAQVERRYEILDTATATIIEAMVETQKWAKIIFDNINKKKDELGNKYKELADKESSSIQNLSILKQRHANCNPFCYIKGMELQENATWTVVKQKLAEITNELASPLAMDSLLSTDVSQFQNPK